MAVPMAFDRVEVIADGGRRRRYDAEEKARLVARAFAPGVSVTTFARERGVDPSLLYRWRRQMGASSAASVTFARALVTPDGSRTASAGAPAARIEIVLCSGRKVFVSETVDEAALARIIAAAERA